MNSIDFDVTVLVAPSSRAEIGELFIQALIRSLEMHGIRPQVLVAGASPDHLPAGVDRLPTEGLGHGALVTAARSRMRSPWLLTVDPDASHDPAFAAVLFRQRNQGDLIIASRYVRFGHAQMPLARDLASRWGNALLRRLLSVETRDLTSSYRLYRREALDECAPTSPGDDALLETLVLFDCAGFRLAEVPVHYRQGQFRREGWMGRLASDLLRAAPGLWKQRNSVFSADYDHRGFFSWIIPQRMWQRKRYQVVRELLGPTPGRIADLGCGSSMIAMSLPDSVCMDLQFKKLRYLGHLGLLLVQGVLADLPLATGVFDTAVCSQVIEHIPRSAIRFSEMNRILKTGGMLVLGTPDYGTYGWNITEFIYKYVMPGGYADEHITHFTFSSLKRELEASGFQLVTHRYVYTGELVMLARKVAESPPGI